MRQQWSVAMENLLDNQMRYAKSRGEAALSHKEEPSACLTVRVYNDGPAIDEDLLKNIFDTYGFLISFTKVINFKCNLLRIQTL